jgi:hypothetical protein
MRCSTMPVLCPTHDAFEWVVRISCDVEELDCLQTLVEEGDGGGKLRHHATAYTVATLPGV